VRDMAHVVDARRFVGNARNVLRLPRSCLLRHERQDLEFEESDLGMQEDIFRIG
jgi:hypothetical protein